MHVYHGAQFLCVFYNYTIIIYLFYLVNTSCNTLTCLSSNENRFDVIIVIYMNFKDCIYKIYHIKGS